MSCITLYKGQDSACKTYSKKYYQQVVLINRDDVDSYDVNIGVASFIGGEIVPQNGIMYNRVRFRLKEGKAGILFRGNERGDAFNAIFSMERDNNIPQYFHNIQLPIFGVTESTKILLKTLDNAEYFAAVQYMDGTVEIYGFENGLITDDYDFEPQGNDGGSAINLISQDNGLEDDPPYIYEPISGNTPTEDFDNLFQDIEDILLGSFNNDFNNDFDIT